MLGVEVVDANGRFQRAFTRPVAGRRHRREMRGSPSEIDLGRSSAAEGLVWGGSRPKGGGQALSFWRRWRPAIPIAPLQGGVKMLRALREGGRMAPGFYTPQPPAIPIAPLQPRRKRGDMAPVSCATAPRQFPLRPYRGGQLAPRVVEREPVVPGHTRIAGGGTPGATATVRRSSRQWARPRAAPARPAWTGTAERNPRRRLPRASTRRPGVLGSIAAWGASASLRLALEELAVVGGALTRQHAAFAIGLFHGRRRLGLALEEHAAVR